MNRPVSIIALTEAGKNLALRLQECMPKAELLYKPRPFTKNIQRRFLSGHALIMICASGIAVRSLASVVNNKHEDPPVLLLDEEGKFVIPLLSGHEGGANDRGAKLAAFLNAQLVLTSAQNYLQPKYTVGMGCERNCSENELRLLLEDCLSQAKLTLGQIESINSIDIKADEIALNHLAESLGKPLQTFKRDELSEVENLLSNKSDYVYSVVGVYGVAESAALVAAQQLTGRDAELLLNKKKSTRATCAIARSYSK